MRVKTFRGESMRAVLAQVRQELGPEAVILGNQTVREDGRSLCEVMAALEQPDRPPLAAPTGQPVAREGKNGGSRPTDRGGNGCNGGNGGSQTLPAWPWNTWNARAWTNRPCWPCIAPLWSAARKPSCRPCPGFFASNP